MMRLYSCSICNHNFPPKKTVVVEYKRVCHDCKKETEKKNRHFKGVR